MKFWIFKLCSKKSLIFFEKKSLRPPNFFRKKVSAPYSFRKIVCAPCRWSLARVPYKFSPVPNLMWGCVCPVTGVGEDSFFRKQGATTFFEFMRRDLFFEKKGGEGFFFRKKIERGEAFSTKHFENSRSNFSE